MFLVVCSLHALVCWAFTAAAVVGAPVALGVAGLTTVGVAAGATAGSAAIGKIKESFNGIME
jgi:hypothetical protein